QSDDIEINGVVKNTKGTPLAQVEVLVQEKTIGVFTDAEGSFKISSSGNSRLVFKKKGFNTMYVPAYEINGSSPIILTESLIDAGDDDNVFIPFGVRKRREVTATVNTVTDANLPQLPLSTLNNALTGRLSGLHIQQT